MITSAVLGDLGGSCQDRRSHSSKLFGRLAAPMDGYVHLVWPPPRTRLAIGKPMAPKPTNPTFIWFLALHGARRMELWPRACASRLHALLHFLITLEADVIEKLHGSFRYFFGVLAWHDNHAIAVCHDHIAGSDQHAA